MKPPRPRIHLVDTAFPLLHDTGVLPRCGQHLAHAEPVFMFSEDMPRVYPPRVCVICLRKDSQVKEGRYYEYGVVEAQEKILEEAG